MRNLEKTSWVGKVFTLPATGSSIYLIVGEQGEDIGILIGGGEINYNFNKRTAIINFKSNQWILLHE